MIVCIMITCESVFTKQKVKVVSVSYQLQCITYDHWKLQFCTVLPVADIFVAAKLISDILIVYQFLLFFLFRDYSEHVRFHARRFSLMVVISALLQAIIIVCCCPSAVFVSASFWFVLKLLSLSLYSSFLSFWSSLLCFVFRVQSVYQFLKVILPRQRY